MSLDESKMKSEASDAIIRGQQTSIDQSIVGGRRTFIEGGQNLALTLSTLEGEYHRLTGTQIVADSVSSTGDTYLNGEKKLKPAI